METFEQLSFSELIIGSLKKAIVDLEEFRLKTALGKAEAQDAYEGAKKQFNKFIHATKVQLENAGEIAKEKSKKLILILEHLLDQLALGNSGTKELFEVQRKKISGILDKIESHLKKNKTKNLLYAKLKMEIEKFRIKLDILKFQYTLNWLRVIDEVAKRNTILSKNISAIKARLLKIEKESENKWEHFRDEISEAYAHLKKAFVVHQA